MKRTFSLAASVLTGFISGCTSKPPLACDLVDRPTIETIVGRKLESVELINEENRNERIGSTCELKFVNRPNMRFWVYRYNKSTTEIESGLPQSRKIPLVKGSGYLADNVIGRDNMIDAYFGDRYYVAVGITFYGSVPDTKKVLVDSANMIIEKMPE